MRVRRLDSAERSAAISAARAAAAARSCRSKSVGGTTDWCCDGGDCSLMLANHRIRGRRSNSQEGQSVSERLRALPLRRRNGMRR
jgi:hypothetical protein